MKGTMKTIAFKRILPILLIALMAVSALFPMGCNPNENTPAGSSPESTPSETPGETPAETPEETPTDTPTETPAETPEESKPQYDVYNITYVLDGGINANNPSTYTEVDEITLAFPIKAGFKFVGWEGTDLTAPTTSVTIPAGSKGDRSYTAKWEELGELTPEDKPTELDKTHFGKDDGITDSGLISPSTTVLVGDRGQGIYITNTVYTTITTDGVKDAAYSYGLRFEREQIEGKGSEYYKENKLSNTFTVYMIRGQEGNLHVFIEVIDNNINITDELWATKDWHCDSIHFYYDFGSTGETHSVWGFGAPVSDKQYVKSTPKTYKIVKSDKGFNIEFEIDNQGKPFMDGDEFGFGVFYNDCVEYTDVNTYKKFTSKIASKLNPAGSGYASPNGRADLNDTLKFSLNSATGNVDSSSSTAEKTGDMLKDIVSGAATVAVIYGTTHSPYTRMQAEAIYSELVLGGANAIIACEADLRRSQTFDYEILVGLTIKREGSKEVIDSMPYNMCGVSIGETKIVVVGWVEQALYDARQVLNTCFEYARHGGETKNLGDAYVYAHKDTAGVNVPHVDEFTIITDAGEGAYMILVRPTTLEVFNGYKQKLVEAGFTLYTENVINENVHFATYYDDTTVVNISFDNEEWNTHDMRIVVEPKSGTALPPLTVESYTPTTTPTLTQLKPNNLTHIIRLDNGEFIIVDSGSRTHHTYIYNELMRQTGNEPAVVAAWIFTHFHQDHIGGFIDFAKDGNTCLEKVTIKSIVYNFPEKQVLDTASSGDQTNLGLWPECLENTGAVIYKARTGQKYAFGNAVVEFLFTYEDLMPFFVEHDRTNPTSMIFSVSLAGQKIIYTGDASSEGTRKCVDRYGKSMAADFVQLSHHGGGDGGTAPAFYTNINAKYVFNPGDGIWISPAEQAACDRALANGGEVFVRDEVGTVTLELPYYGKTDS